MGEVTTSGLQHAAQVLKYLTGLGPNVPLPDHGAVGVPRHLSRDIQEAASFSTRGHFIVRHRFGFSGYYNAIWHTFLLVLGHRRDDLDFHQKLWSYQPLDLDQRGSWKIA